MPQGAQQCHEKRPLGVALPKAVGEDVRCGDAIVDVVAKQHLVAYVVVDSPYPLCFGKLVPTVFVNQRLNGGAAVIKHRCFPQVSIHGAPFFSWLLLIVREGWFGLIAGESQLGCRR